MSKNAIVYRQQQAVALNLRKITQEEGIITFLAWTTEAGFPAIINYHKELGFYCGYIGIPRSHPLYGASYHEPNKYIRPMDDDEPIGKRGIMPVFFARDMQAQFQPDVAFNVHGGITYADNRGKYQGTKEDYPSKGLFPGCWWFGFDCGHAGDAYHTSHYEQIRMDFPNQLFMGYPIPGDVFRDVPYVVEECESLARQLILRVRNRNILEWFQYIAAISKEWYDEKRVNYANRNAGK